MLADRPRPRCGIDPLRWTPDYGQNLSTKGENQWASIAITTSSVLKPCAWLEQPGDKRKIIAESLGISEQTLYVWLRNDDARRLRTPESDRQSDEERAELKRLRKEVASLKEDKEILRKAAAYFAKETK